MTRIVSAMLLALALVAGQPSGAEPRVPEGAAEITLSFAPVVRKAAPAVVNIYARRIVAGRANPFAGDPFFEDFFRSFGRATPRVENSLGSGVILSAAGFVVSNYHVVGQATDIRVVLADRREYDAEVVLGDQGNDLAVLRLIGAPEDLPVLALRDSDTLEVGDLVLAIGNPFGIGQTVSSGIVSGLARSGLFAAKAQGYFIQTDAAINPFAIPANLVAQFVAQAEAGAARFLTPWAGISGQAVDADLAAGLGLARPGGMVIAAIHPQSPFAAVGLRQGDVVVSVDDRPVNTPQEMQFRIAQRGIGAEVTLGYLRGSDAHTARVTLAAAPEDPPRDAHLVPGDSPLAGLQVSNINPAVIAETDLPLDARGVVV
ncbi:MAG: serine protease, partial [Alphaproteobacteria bacterium HGW-Alphaproteobacteria-2]